jgi:polysaccharide biosynthesis/export protein
MKYFFGLLLALMFGMEALAKTPISPPLPEIEPSILAAYLLGPGDRLDISALGYAEYTGSQIILPDGTITLPVIGRVIAAGKTTKQLSTELVQRLKPYLVAPDLNIRVSSLRPLLITLTGEVQRPGPVQLNSLGGASAGGAGSSSSSAPTLSQAILLAGGITQEADIRGVILSRFQPGGAPINITLNLWETLRAPGGPPDLLLRDGDTLHVPRARAVSEVDLQVLSRSSFSPRSIKVRVVGEVTAPGEKEVPPNTTVSQSVAVAGGPTRQANLAAVRYVRLLPNGVIEQKGVNISDLGDTVTVQNGDVIVVPPTDISKGSDILRQILDPLILLRLFR